jgi:hypothetical protein
MARRSGVSLVEVLVTLFITAIGLLALLSLFPVGAVSMARALKDSRCAQAAYNGAHISSMMGFSSDSNVTTYQGGGAGTTNWNSLFAPTWPPPGGYPAMPAVPMISSQSGPSFPIYVDVVPSTPWIGSYYQVNQAGPQSPGIIRCVPTTINSTLQSLKFFALTDDITFQMDGVPPPAVQREDRYTWGCMYRQPLYNGGTTKTTVAVYSGRSTVILGETVYPGINFTNSNTIDVYVPPGQEPPAVRAGSWILDATVIDPFTGTPDPHGIFYRVVGITDVGPGVAPPNVVGTEHYVIELETSSRIPSIHPSLVPITLGGVAYSPQTFPQYPPPLNSAIPYGIMVVMDNLSEVFER